VLHNKRQCDFVGFEVLGTVVALRRHHELADSVGIAERDERITSHGSEGSRRRLQIRLRRVLDCGRRYGP
jgi:hypothetical protein